MRVPVRFRFWPGRWAVCMLAALSLTACGGGGGSSSTSGTGGGTASYTIGGSISGLTASGLVLADGSDTLSVAANATSFTFGQAVSSGSTYDVTVATQPTGETCSVSSGGSGTATTNVTSVSVKCAANTYSVGGTVSGLNASGLVLQNNGSDNLTVKSGAATFTFATPLDYGANYAVTVSTQPTGETCTVSSGTGTVKAAVTTVKVSCVPTTYTVGGTVSGLNASGLVLQDNGGDNLTVNSGAATFTFATALDYGAKYAVTVYTQPTGETCSVSSGSGTVSQDVTTVSVSCSAITLSVSGGASGLTAAGLKVRFYAAGQALAVSPVASGSAPYTYSNVPYGTSIAMVIAAQPGWETCAAASGNFSGTITNDVTGENLTCTADTPTANTVTTTGTALSGPDGVAVDSAGNVFIADTAANEILMVSPSGAVTQLATAASPNFNSPDGIAVDSHGNVYVADTNNNLVREIVASNGVVSSSSPVITLNDNGAAAYNQPEGVAVDASGNVYVADTFDNDIREIEASNGSVSASSPVVTLAGGTTTGCMDGSGPAAEFDAPTGIAVDASGDLYVADSNNNVIRKITSVGPTGSNTVTTWAGGQGTCNSLSPATGGYVDGASTTQALFQNPTGVAVDAAGNVFVADLGNNAVREITPAGMVSTLAGAANPTGGTTTPYPFKLPFGITVGSADTLYVSNTQDSTVVTLTP